MKTPEDNDSKYPVRKKRSFVWYLIIFLLVGMIIWYVVSVFNNSNSNKLNGADLNGVKTTTPVDEESDGIIDGDDLVIKNTGSDKDSDPYKGVGTLARILAYENVTKLTVTTHYEPMYMVIDGTFVYDKDGVIANLTKNTKYSFSAVISLSDTQAIENLHTLINYRQRKSSSGEVLQYYTGTAGIVTYSDYTKEVNWSSIIMEFLMWALIIGIGIYFISRLSRSVSGMMGSGSQMSFNSSRARRETHTKVRFSDVAGCDEVKAELVELVDYFRNGQAYTKLGAKLPKGFLLVGPPGTGKTLLAKAVAGEANVPFYSISGSDFVEMYVGVGAGRVRDMFKVAKQNKPCLIFIDEIDAVGRQRGAGLGGGNDEREQTLNQLLVEMDGFEDNSGVIVMAATNRADVLDPALTRAGRFDRQITVDLPDKEGRAAILKVHARNKVVAKSVDFDAIASRTVGFSGADLANILNDAAILAVREKKVAIDMDDIDEAIDRSIAGPAKTNKGMSEAEKKRVAYHESGHAVIGIRLQHSEKVQRITIIPRGRTGGHVLMTPETDRYVLTKEELIAQITGLLGGRTSEEIFFGDVSTGASNDIEQATRIARMMVTEYGMSDLGPIQYERNSGSVFLGRDYSSQQANYSTQVAYEIDKAVRSIISDAHENCKKLLLQYKDDVELIAKTLIEKETITAEQIDYLIENRKLPEKEESKKEGPSLDDKGLESKEEKLEEIEAPKYNKEGQDFHKMIENMSSSVSLIILFVEEENGRNLTTRQCNKIIKDSTISFIERTKALGEPASNQMLKSAISLTARKELWSQFAKTGTEFGNYVEQTSGVDVVYVDVNKDTISRWEKAYASNKDSDSGKISLKAKKLSDELKSAAKEDEENKDKK